MRSYQGFVLSLGLFLQVPFAQAFAQDPTTPPEDSGVAPAPNPAPTPVTPPTKPAPQGTAPVTPGKILPPGAPRTKKKVVKKKVAPGSLPLQTTASVNPLDAAVVGEAQVLPKNVFRGRYILKTVSATKGYDGAGEEQDLGASLSAVGHAAVLEYGITDRWVFQLIAPYTSSNELVINANKFKTSQVYAEQYAKFVGEVAPTLIQNGICADLASCRTAIDNGLALGTATPVELPSGETATVGANVPIRDAINSIILKSIEPGAGKEGLGDVQVGIGYNAINTSVNVFTIGLGMRFPSGLFSNVASAYRAPGAGFLATGLLLKYDLRLTPVIISWSHQAEYSLNKAKRMRSSLLSPGFLNGQDPTTNDPDIPGAGDGSPNEMMIERKGVYHLGYTRIAYTLGHMTNYLKPVAIYGFWGYSVDPEYHNQGSLYKEKEQLYTAALGFSVDGLAMNPIIPASFTYKHEVAVGGRNAFLAPDSDLFQFSVYYKF